MTGLGLDVGSRTTKLAWHGSDGPDTRTVDAARTDPAAVRSALASALTTARCGPFDDVVIALPEQWRKGPDPAVRLLVGAVRDVVGDARIEVVGTPVAVACLPDDTAPPDGRLVVVDAGATTVDVAVVLRTSGKVGLLRHDSDPSRSSQALDALLRHVCRPRPEHRWTGDVALVGGHAAEDWVGDTVRSVAGEGASVQVATDGSAVTAAARGALRIAEHAVDPVARYPHRVVAEVGIRRDDGLLENEWLELAAADELEVGGFTAHPILGPERPARIEDGGVDDLPRLWVDAVDGRHALPAPTGTELPRGRYTVALRLDRRRNCVLELLPVGEPGPAPIVVRCGTLPTEAVDFPPSLKADIDLIQSWHVSEIADIPLMREAIEDVQRELSDEVKYRKLSSIVDAALEGEVAETDKPSARSIWRDYIMKRWHDIDVRIAHSGKMSEFRKDARRLREALLHVDDYLRDVPEADWPAWPPAPPLTTR